MSILILDTETTWSWRKKYVAKRWKEVSDKGSPFNPENRIVCVGAYSYTDNNYYLFDFDSDSGARERLAELLQSHEMLVGHNIKFDIHHLRQAGFQVHRHKQVDTLVNEHILSGGKDTLNKLGLDKVAPKYGGTCKIDLTKRYWEAGINTDKIPKSILHRYLRSDVFNTKAVYEGQRQILAESVTEHPHRKIALMSVDLNSVTEEMEFNGISIDDDQAEITKKAFEDGFRDCDRRLQDIVHDNSPEGEKIDIGSRQQLSQLLYSLRLKADKRGDWKAFVSSFRPGGHGAQTKLRDAIDECFEKLDYGFKVEPHLRFIGPGGLGVGSKAIDAIQDRGGLSKRAKLFIDTFVEHGHWSTWLSLNFWSIAANKSADGKVHASFHQAGTHTGRYSSSNPNIQQLPNAAKWDGKNTVRKMIVSQFGDEGYILCPDYSQLELRVVMELAKDINGITDYREGIDIHGGRAKWAYESKNGEGSWELLTDEKRKELRTLQKTVNFGLIYGAVPKDDLQKDMYDSFYSRYTNVGVWNETTVDLIKQLGYYESPLTGFRYNFEGADDSNFWRGYSADQKGWRNKAFNYPVQGDSGRIVQVAMIGVYQDIVDNPLIKFAAQVHDEIILDVHQNALDKAIEICYKRMEGVNELFYQYFGYEIEIPLEVEIKYGRNWYDVKEQ